MRLLLIFMSLVIFAFSFQYEEQPRNRTVFALSLMPSANSSLYTFAIVTINDKNEVLSKRFVSEHEFMKMIAGKYPCKANPSMVNLFEYIGFDDCGLVYNEYTKKYETYVCPPFRDLWKLWYQAHPFSYDAGEGWAHTPFSPSLKQIKILGKYGLYHKGSLVVGDNMWQLLLDIQKPEWIDKYTASGQTN